MSEDRKVSSVKVYAKTDDASILKVKALTFQENVIPKEKDQIYVPTPYTGWDHENNEWSYESPDYADYGADYTPVLTATPSGPVWDMGGGGALYIQISITGWVADGIAGPPVLVPRTCRVVEVKQYCRAGSCSIAVRKATYEGAVARGQMLIKDQVLSAYVSRASADCMDAIVQVRCI